MGGINEPHLWLKQTLEHMSRLGLPTLANLGSAVVF
jgi:hypothetical protein